VRFVATAKLLMITVAVALGASACTKLGTLTGFLEEEDVILPGQREEVIASVQDVDPDATLVGTPVVVPAAYTNPNWALPGGISSNALQHVSLSSNLSQAWSVGAGAGSSSHGRLTAAPIVVNGRIYVLDTEATLRAFDASNGNRLWERALTPDAEESDEGYGGGVASDGNKIYVSTAFGNVMALNATNGELIWGKRLDSPIRAAPNVSDGRLFITTINNEVYCLSTEDGFTLWRFDGIGEAASLLASTSSAVEGDVAVIPYTSGEIIAFSASDGRPLWSDSLVRTGALSSLSSLNDIAGRPVIEGNQVIAIGHSGRMVAIDATSGARQWSKNISGTQTPWIAGPNIFVIAGTKSLMALTRDEGRVRWSVELPSEQVWSGPVLAGGRLIVVSSAGAMAQVDVQSGSILTQSQVGDGLYISPVVAGGTIYLLTEDATLVAMR
jgi:outer membrane protein assembly factor BamB